MPFRVSPEWAGNFMSVTSAITSRKRSWLLRLLALVLLVSSIVPWLKNHRYIRDFMDYGLVMAGSGRIGDGEAPYVDFITPIQAGFLHLNRLAEILGGGTYLGMTYGGLTLIVVSFVVLFAILRQHTSFGLAAGFAWGITVCTSSQHIIIWHNTLGVLAMTVAIWIAAIVSGNRHPKWYWYLGLVSALWVGGINKISFQLVALAGVTGFFLRARFLGQSNTRHLLFQLAGIISVGVVLPIATELILTGASIGQWHYNVMALAGAARAEYVKEMAGMAFYLRPLHDYYGLLPVPQFGILFVVMILCLAIAGWQNRPWQDRLMLLAASLGCMAVPLLLLATNHEIAYVTGGAAIGLTISLCLGFGIKLNSARWGNCLAAISVLMAGPAWWSAWKGERSQFGHSPSPRSSYSVLADKAPEFAYLEGIKVPPEATESYVGLINHIGPPDERGQYAVFYATGVEWLERVWPMQKVEGLPLWMHDGTSYGPSESDLLLQMIMPPARFDQLVTSVPWDHWPGQAHVPVTLFTTPKFCGSVVKVYYTQQDLKLSNDPIRLINIFGTNFEPRLLRFDDDTLFNRTKEGRVFFGTDDQPTEMGLEWKGSRLLGEPVIVRKEGAPRIPLKASFRIEYEVDGVWHHIWNDELELTPTESAKTGSISFDGRQRELRFMVELDEESRGRAAAGWHPPTLLDSRPSPENPPPLVRKPSAVNEHPEQLLDDLIAPSWRPDGVFIRGGSTAKERVLLGPGDQIWLQANQPLKAMNGLIRVPDGDDRNMPLVRVLWWKAGRVQIAWQDTLNEDSRSHHFHAWSPGPEGWFGILVDPIEGTASVEVRIDEIVSHP